MMAFDINIRIRDEGRTPLHDLVKINVYDAQTSVPIVILDEFDVDLEGGLRVQALRNHHPPVHHSFALRFDAGQKSVTFSGDTAYLPALADFAKGTDILVHEAMLAKGIDLSCLKPKLIMTF